MKQSLVPYMQRDVVHEHPSCRDVRHEVLLQLLVLGEEVGGQRFGLGVDVVDAFFDVFDLETQFQNEIRPQLRPVGTTMT